MVNKFDTQGTLYVHVEQNVATVAFGHPKQNAFPAALLRRLTQAINELSQNKAIRVMVLKSDDNYAFCAGASFDELLQISNPQEGKQFFMGFAKLINAMRKAPFPIIGRIHGRAVGGGVGLVAACDYALATVEASVKLSEIAIGIGPFVIAPALMRKIGAAGLSALSLAAHEWKNAYWAQEQGLFVSVFENTDDLDQEVKLMAEKLASYAPEGVAELKKTLWQGTEDWDQLLEQNAETSGRLILLESTQQTLQKIKNKK